MSGPRAANTGRSQFPADALGRSPRSEAAMSIAPVPQGAGFVFSTRTEKERRADQAPCFRRLLQSLQNFGHFSPLVFPAAFASFHSALHFLRRSLNDMPDLSSDFFLVFSLVVAISAAARSTGRITAVVPARNATEKTVASVRFNMDETPSWTAWPDRPGPERAILQPA